MLTELLLPKLEFRPLSDDDEGIADVTPDLEDDDDDTDEDDDDTAAPDVDDEVAPEE